MKNMSAKMLKQLRALRRLPDDKIDFSDIPEVTSFEGWVRGRFYRPVKQPVTIRLDADILSWLKSEGEGYQTRVNQLLRKEMMKVGKQRKRA